jgi:8-oxo-dGTP pyrophosphatase MutT (NUDIX family)
MTRLLHAGVSWFQALRRLVWYFTRSETVGVHGIPLTADGKVVLVTLSYAHGWRLPGGGMKKAEDGEAAMLRELREEIGLTGHQSIDHVAGFEHRPDLRRGTGSLFVIRGVQYRPKWSLEVKRVAEFNLDDLPAETATITRQLLALADLL